MMMRVLNTLVFLTMPLTALAIDENAHVFVAYSEQLHRKISFISPLDRTRPSVLTISQELDQYPWEKVLYKTEVNNPSVTADRHDRVQKRGNGFIANLEESGKARLVFHGDGNCRVVSTLPAFQLPAGESIQNCTYFFTRGPRPGFSGSN